MFARWFALAVVMQPHGRVGGAMEAEADVVTSA